MSWRCYQTCLYATAATTIFDASSGLCQLCFGSPQVGFIFRVEYPSVLYIICLVYVLMSAFYFQVPCWMPYSSWGAQPLGFAPLQPFGVYLWHPYVQPGLVIGPHQACTEWLLPPLLLIGGAYYSITCHPAVQSLCLPCIVGRGLLFQVWFHPVTWSTLNLQWALNLVILVW